MGGSGDWTRALQTWLEPFLARLGQPARRRMGPLYVAGLMGPGERKSLQPIAARLAPADYDQLHHFIAVGPWDDEPLEAELLAQADRLVGGPDAILVIDDTALPKKGQLSVGVAPQYASALGKNANCQTLVSLTLAQGEVPVPIALRLFLPEAWTQDPERMRRAGVPEACQTARSKPEIALAELKRARNAGVRFRAVVADAGYGISAAFRQALSAWGLLWAVGIPRIQKVYPVEVQLVPAPPTRGRPRKTRIPVPHGGDRARHASRTWRRLRLKRWWRPGPGAGSPGGRAPRDLCGPSLPRYACGSRMGLRCGCGAGPASIFRAPRSGLGASAARQGSRSITCRTCRPTHR
jgi:SRSO17 transposase